MAQCVLIVDDDPVQRRLIGSMVAISSFEPPAFTGGDAAIVGEDGSAPQAALWLDADDGEVRRLEPAEANAIRFIVAHYHGIISEVARRLGISRSALFRALGGLGLTSAAETAAEAPANVAIG